MRTFFDEDNVSDDQETRAKRLEEFPETFVPFAQALPEDFRTACDFVKGLNTGLQTLTNDQFSVAEKAAWTNAQKYLDARPF